VGGEGHGCVAGVEGEEFGAEFGEIDFLGVGGAVGVWWVENFSTNEGFEGELRVKLEGVRTFAQDHGTGEVLD
jgi:hypothetical protein